MVPFAHSPCPYPKCKGEKINYKAGGKALWYCSEEGERHRIVWRAAKLKAILDIKQHGADPNTITDRTDEFIKEYEAYVKAQDRESTP